MLATCYARPTSASFSTADALELLHEAYDDEPFVHVTSGVPSTKATLGSNSVHVTARVDPRTGWLIAISALDNLGKGAAGAAIQAMNASCGFDETLGLPIAGLYP
jgi:N-acetyl-gamma-glutamyl-phosphate reductase